MWGNILRKTLLSFSMHLLQCIMLNFWLFWIILQIHWSTLYSFKNSEKHFSECCVSRGQVWFIGAKQELLEADRKHPSQIWNRRVVGKDLVRKHRLNTTCRSIIWFGDFLDNVQSCTIKKPIYWELQTGVFISSVDISVGKWSKVWCLGRVPGDFYGLQMNLACRNRVYSLVHSRGPPLLLGFKFFGWQIMILNLEGKQIVLWTFLWNYSEHPLWPARWWHVLSVALTECWSGTD